MKEFICIALSGTVLTVLITILWSELFLLKRIELHIKEIIQQKEETK